MSDGLIVPGSQNQPALPPVIADANTPEIKRRVENFHSVASIFEAWANRRKSNHTRRAYRGDVMAFVEFRGWIWPNDSAQLLRVSILDVQAFKDYMVKRNAAPKTMNRRISSLSSFYRYLAGAAAELRLPITVPNPAHAQFIARDSSDPVDETRALSETRARQLVAMPASIQALEAGEREGQQAEA
jgi:site-specific recombinase XerC